MCALFLHNLIICIEGDNFDNQWRETLVRWGMDHEPANGDSDEEPEGELEHMWQQIEMDGQWFRLKYMDDLFDSPFCEAVHHL